MQRFLVLENFEPRPDRKHQQEIDTLLNKNKVDFQYSNRKINLLSKYFTHSDIKY